MPRLFERFHRVEGARGRTHEGTGIGLALVQELVKLHGGSIFVESELGRGSTFSVHIPFGTAHLPLGRHSRSRPRRRLPRPRAPRFTWTRRWVGCRWMANRSQPRNQDGSRVFAPLSQRLSQLDGSPKQPRAAGYCWPTTTPTCGATSLACLSPHFDVEAVSDGQEALKRALNRPPDLILSDIMMPGLDGFALLKALRTESSTRTLPVILLSARAGEESRVEGIEAGADDYLVKPFTARELLARVTTHLAMSRLRRQAAERERELRRESEAARERATSAAEALRQANSDLEQFAFSASHDLQEPLRMVATFSQLLQVKYAGKLDEQADTIIEHCVEGASRMGRMIRDLLEYTRAASISASQPEMVSLEEALEEALGNLQASIDESKAIVTHDPLPALAAEPVHLQQIFQNLVSNAIKYRGHQTPRIHIGAVREGDAWRFSVEDNGIGIEPRYKDQVFGLFKRLHSGTRYSGTGLGLAICKKLVERYHGRIWVESQPGVRLHVFLHASAKRTGGKRAGLMAKSPYQIWIAEDNPADVYLIEEALRRHEFAYHLEIADNGEDMLKMITGIDQDPSANCPDLFLIDLNLPRRPGDEILARIRQSSRCAQVPAIVITSSDSPQDRARARELGASFYFRKPADLEKFMTIGGIVRGFLERESDGVPQASPC